MSSSEQKASGRPCHAVSAWKAVAIGLALPALRTDRRKSRKWTLGTPSLLGTTPSTSTIPLKVYRYVGRLSIKIHRFVDVKRGSQPGFVSEKRVSSLKHDDLVVESVEFSTLRRCPRAGLD